MALLEDAFKGGNLLAGVGVAFGAVVLAPVVVPLVRPVAKSIVKAGLIAYDHGRGALSEINERAGDVVAEARAEMQKAPAHDGKGAEGEQAIAARPSSRKKGGEARGGEGEPAPAI